MISYLFMLMSVDKQYDNSIYRVVFLTGPPIKSSKYKKS